MQAKEVPSITASKKLTKELVAEWCERLKESGFHDIEFRTADGLCSYGQMKRERSFPKALPGDDNAHILGFDEHIHVYTLTDPPPGSSVEYYEMATLFLKSHKFRKGQKAVWALHCQGYSSSEVAKALGRHERIVLRTVRTLEKSMRTNGV